MPLPDLGFAIGLPPEKAIEYFESKGYAIGFKWQEVWAEAHAKAFTVAGITKLDVLQDIRGELDALLKNGGTLQDFKNNLIPTLKQKGWWGKGQVVDVTTGEVEGKRLNPRRLETIFRTNMQSSYMAGRYQEQLASAGSRPFWEYVAILDNRTRPRHRALAGRIFRYDDPFWASFYPPNGWNCRCRVRTRSQREVENKNLDVSSSAGRMGTTDQVIDRKGSIRPAPVYHDPAGEAFTADPGFGYNPGRAAYQPELDAYAKDSARQYVKGTISGPAFSGWYRDLAQATRLIGRAMPDATAAEIAGQLSVGQRYPVAVLGAEEMSVMRTDAQTIWLTDQSLATQLADGRALKLAEFDLVQDTLEQADVVVRQGELFQVFSLYGDQVMQATLAADQSGSLNVQAFVKSSRQAMKHSMEAGDVIRNLH